ncbi:hypothetical protein B0H10DRAFT_1758884, partial [Mycena sp. CBHHK59/15]
LPQVYGLYTAHLLVYVEWYTPFGTPNPISGLFTIKTSTRNNHVYGEIIEVDHILQNCHLLPKYSQRKDPTWMTENVGE